LSLCVIAGLLGAYLFLTFVPPKYKASAQLIFDPGVQQVIGAESGLVPNLLATRTLERVVTLLESPAILKQVALKLIADRDAGKAKNPGTAIQRILSDPQVNAENRVPRLIAHLQRDLTVKTEAGEEIITVEFSSKSAQEAADIANLIVQSFIQDRTETRQAAITHATRWLDERVVESRDKLAAADKKIEAYKLQHKLDNEATAAIAGVQLRELQREREAIKTLYEGMLGKVGQITAQQKIAESEFRVLVDAVTPEQAKLNPIFVWICGALGGLALGILLSLMLEYFDDRLIQLHDVEQKLPANVLARVPVIRPIEDSSGFAKQACLKGRRFLRFAKDNPQSLFTDCLVGAKIAMGDFDSKKVVMVTSPMQGEGKTQIATNLASLSALLGKKTLLIDLDARQDSVGNDVSGTADARDPRLKAFLEASGMTQFVSAAAEEDDYDTVRFRACDDAIWLRLMRPQMRELLEFARQNYDCVWLDTVPALVFPDASILAKHADKVVIVGAWSKTSVKQLKETIELMRSGGGEVAGVIINKVKVDRLISAAMASYKDYYADRAKSTRSVKIATVRTEAPNAADAANTILH
jgi:Mrp family chromosome partitioning ATPase/capsular polysaccharide biosynthesis protein